MSNSNNGMPPFLLKMKQHITPRVEVALRVALSNFVGFCLAIGAPSSVTPQTTAYLIGIMASVLSIVLPSLLFGIGLGFPAVISVMALGLIFSSMLLAAATVSDGLLTFVYALYALWICGLRYGPHRQQLSGLAGVLVMIGSMMALSFRTLVQDGISVTVPWPVSNSDNPILPLVVVTLRAICNSQGLAQDCWKEALPWNDDGSFQVDIQEGMFEGQTATVVVDATSSSATVSLEGGLWIVAGLWTWQGLENPLANNRNFLINVCWGLLCVMCGMVMPPFRTIRAALSRTLLPAALHDVQAAFGDANQMVLAKQQKIQQSQVADAKARNAADTTSSSNEEAEEAEEEDRNNNTAQKDSEENNIQAANTSNNDEEDVNNKENGNSDSNNNENNTQDVKENSSHNDSVTQDMAEEDKQSKEENVDTMEESTSATLQGVQEEDKQNKEGNADTKEEGTSATLQGVEEEDNNNNESRAHNMERNANTQDGKENNSEDDDDDDDVDLDKLMEEREARYHRLLKYLNALMGSGGSSLAIMTAFEYRLVTAPFECIWPYLADLMLHTNSMVYVSIAIAKWHPDVLKDQQVNTAIERCVSTIAACSKALARNEDPTKQLTLLQQESGGAMSSKTEEGAPTEQQQHDVESPPPHLHHDVVQQKDRLITQLSQKVLDSTITWLNAMLHPESPSSPTTKKFWSAFAKTYGLMLAVPVLLLKKLFMVVLVPFRPDTWDVFVFLEYLKYPTGFVALFIMSVYWEGYANLALNVDNAGASGLYSGWNLVAYTFSWTLTLEGSLKKGLARATGTCLGGLFAFLGIIICSGSSDASAEVNPYGLVTWLTITTGIAGYNSVEPGFSARLGKSKDYGNIWFYFILTQTICALEVEAGKGQRDDIIVNRIVANLSGIAMAGIMAALPPYTRGGDPKHAREFLMEMVKAMTESLDALLSQQGSGDEVTAKDLDKLQTHFKSTALEKRSNAQFLLKDASSLSRLPFLKPDPKLNEEIQDMTVTGSLVFSFMTFASYLAKSDFVGDLLEPSSTYYMQLEDAMKELLREKHANEPPSSKKMVKNLETNEEYVATLLELMWAILHRLEMHDQNLMKLDKSDFLEHFMDEH